MASEILLTLYRADCGRRFRRAASAVSHEANCWKSPALRTCKTCAHGRRTPYEDDVGAGGDMECRNPLMDEDEFTAAHEKAPDICIRCPRWEPKLTADGRPFLGTCGQGRIS